MTTDALLALALSVAMPSLMALAGAVLAARSLPSEKRTERFSWIALFVFLTLVSIGLAFVQQIRITAAQQAETQRANARQQIADGNQKYTQGQLDSINHVLTAVVASPSLPQTTAVTLAGLLSASRQAASSRPSADLKPPSTLSNAELFPRAIAIASKLRTIGAKYQASVEATQYNEEPTSQAKADITKAHTEALASWGDIRVECDLVLAELHARIPPGPGREASTDWMAESEIDQQAAVSANAYILLASRIEAYADLLPRSRK